MRIKGKIAIWFWIMFVGMEILMLYLFFEPSKEGKDVGMLVIMIFDFLGWNIVFLPMLVKNYAEIDGERLILVLGLCRTTIEIGEIREVYKTHNPIASGALSLDRVDRKSVV